MRNNPFAIDAFFRRSLVLAYAVPKAGLEPLLDPGLELDGYAGYGFIAIALVETERLRPSFLPATFGRSLFFAGYRIFVRHRRADGRRLRGLKILRSDTDRRSMVATGNLMTRYRWHAARVVSHHEGDRWQLDVKTPDGAADVHVVANLEGEASTLPPGSPFRSLEDARRFAGPMPYTFGYDDATRTMVSVKGVREAWDPAPVHIEAATSSFLQRPPFAALEPVLANAFYVENIPYRWQRGHVEQVAS